MSTAIGLHAESQPAMKYVTILLTVAVPGGEQEPLDIQVKNGHVVDWKLLGTDVLVQKSGDAVFLTSAMPSLPLHDRAEMVPPEALLPLEPPTPVKKELGETSFEVYDDISNMKNHPFPLIPDPECFLNLTGTPKTEDISANILDTSSVTETMSTVKLPDDLSPVVSGMNKETSVSVQEKMDKPIASLLEQDSCEKNILSARMSDEQYPDGEGLLSRETSDVADLGCVTRQGQPDMQCSVQPDQAAMYNAGQVSPSSQEFVENIYMDASKQKGYFSFEQLAYTEPKKRGRPRKLRKTMKTNTTCVLGAGDQHATKSAPKKRGRPPKAQSSAKSRSAHVKPQEPPNGSGSVGDCAAKTERKKRGRPRKHPLPEASDTDAAEKIEVLDGGSTLRCKVCGITAIKDKKFNSKAGYVMKRHIAAIHEVAGRLEEARADLREKLSHSQQPTCFVCDTSYDSDASLIIHTSQHLVQRYYIEPKMLRDLSMTYVKLAPDNSSAFQCIKCGFQDESFAQLKRHILESHLRIRSNHERQEMMKEAMTEKYKDFISGSSCAICGFTQDHEPTLRLHIDSLHLKELLLPSGVGSGAGGTSTEEPVTLEKQGEAHTLATLRHFDQVIKNYHRDVYIRNDRLICDICGYVGRFKCNLDNHMAAQHGIGTGKYRCPDCPKVTRSSKQLSSHRYNVHVQPFIECIYPGCKEIVRKHCMKNHIKRAHEHDREKPVCVRCGKCFTNSYSLQQHINSVHENKREYACDWPGCGKKFAKLWSRTIHYRIHTDEKPLQCELCGFQGRQKASMDSHYKVHHMNKVRKTSKQEEKEVERLEEPEPQMILSVIL